MEAIAERIVSMAEQGKHLTAMGCAHVFWACASLRVRSLHFHGRRPDQASACSTSYMLFELFRVSTFTPNTIRKRETFCSFSSVAPIVRV